MLHVVVTHIAKLDHWVIGCQDLDIWGRVLLWNQGSQDEWESIRLVLIQKN